jgi:hypothetical protein
MPLTNIPIPLRPSDRDVVLQIQPLIDDCYRDGRYQRINYRLEPVPRLGEGDARWTDQLLREKGLKMTSAARASGRAAGSARGAE